MLEPAPGAAAERTFLKIGAGAETNSVGTRTMVLWDLGMRLSIYRTLQGGFFRDIAAVKDCSLDNMDTGLTLLKKTANRCNETIIYVFTRYTVSYRFHRSETKEIRFP